MPVRPVRLHRHADRATFRRPVPAAAHRHRHACGFSGQVFINVGYVVGLLPVTGLQLPLISAGGTSTATTLLIIGVIANAARHEPEAVAALRAGRDDRMNRMLRLPLPEPYVANPHRGATRPTAVAPEVTAKPRRRRRRRRRKPARRRASPSSGRSDARRSTSDPSAIRRTAPTGPSGPHNGRSALRVNRSRGRRRPGISVVLAGGGTAGHVEPAMAVADALTALDPDVRITALGTERGLETRLVPERGYCLELITPVPLPRKPSGDLLRLPFRVRRAVRQTRAVLDEVDADVVVGFGGYVALPAYLPRARRARVPVVIHEANASAGLGQPVGARSAPRVLSAVPDPGLRARRGRRRAGARGHHLAGPDSAARRGPRTFRFLRRCPGVAGVRRVSGRAVDQPRRRCGR